MGKLFRNSAEDFVIVFFPLRSILHCVNEALNEKRVCISSSLLFLLLMLSSPSLSICRYTRARLDLLFLVPGENTNQLTSRSSWRDTKGEGKRAIHLSFPSTKSTIYLPTCTIKCIVMFRLFIHLGAVYLLPYTGYTLQPHTAIMSFLSNVCFHPIITHTHARARLKTD